MVGPVGFGNIFDYFDVFLSLDTNIKVWHIVDENRLQYAINFRLAS